MVGRCERRWALRTDEIVVETTKGGHAGRTFRSRRRGHGGSCVCAFSRRAWSASAPGPRPRRRGRRSCRDSARGRPRWLAAPLRPTQAGLRKPRRPPPTSARADRLPACRRRRRSWPARRCFPVPARCPASDIPSSSCKAAGLTLADRLAHAPAEVMQEVPDQIGNVFAAFAQRRDVDREHVQPKEQVGPEAALVHRGRQVPVRGRDDAHVHRDRPGCRRRAR